MMEGPCADSEEKHEPASDIDTVVVDSLKVLDPNRAIREADIGLASRNVREGPNADIGSDPMADVRDIESGKVRATRELFEAD
jgi:hypothetical protein